MEDKCRSVLLQAEIPPNIFASQQQPFWQIHFSAADKG